MAVVVHIFSHSAQEAEMDICELEVRLVYTERVLGESGLHRETLSHKTKKEWVNDSAPSNHNLYSPQQEDKVKHGHLTQ